MATDPNNDQAVVFDEKQQEKVNELIRVKMGEAAKEVRTQLAAKEAEAATLAADLAAARAALDKAKTTTQKKAASEDIEALQAQMNEMKTVNLTAQQELERANRLAADKAKEAQEAKNETLKVKKEVAIQRAASKMNFVDPAIVSKLTEDSIKWDADKGRFMVVNPETGTERLNSSMEPLSLEELYKEFAVNNPYLVRADARGGAGSSPSQGLSSNGKYEVKDIFGKESSGAKAMKLMKENPQEYHRLKAVAKENGFI